MPYFSNQPGPTPYQDLPLPQSIVDRIKAKSDFLAKQSKRKLSEETAGFDFIYIINYFAFKN